MRTLPVVRQNRKYIFRYRNKSHVCLKHCKSKSTGNKFTQKALGVKLVVKLNSRHLGLAEGEVGIIFVVVHDVCESLV